MRLRQEWIFGLLIACATLGSAGAQPSGGEDVTFTVHDARAGRLALRGKLWMPAGDASAAVVLVHGSGGWTDEREGHYARAFIKAGFAALAIDSFGPRGINDTVDDQSRVSSLQMTRDAFAASRWLSERGIAIDRQALMGFSKGGAVALFAADKTFLPKESVRFAAVLPFYPACSTRARHPKPVSRVFMVLAEKDDYSGVESCQELAAAWREAGGNVEVKVYPDSAHAFDGDPGRTGMRRLSYAEVYKDCRLFIEDDGSSTLGDQHFAAGDPKVNAAMKATCMRKGASVWTNLRQKQAATEDALAFLRRSFDR